MSSRKPTSRLTCQRGESRVFFFAYSPMPRSGRTGDDIRQSGHVRLEFIMHASHFCIARILRKVDGREDVLLWSTAPPCVLSVGHARFSRETLATSLPECPSRLSSGTKDDITVWITSCINASRRDGSRSFMIYIAGSSGLSAVKGDRNLGRKRTR